MTKLRWPNKRGCSSITALPRDNEWADQSGIGGKATNSDSTVLYCETDQSRPARFLRRRSCRARPAMPRAGVDADDRTSFSAACARSRNQHAHGGQEHWAATTPSGPCGGKRSGANDTDPARTTRAGSRSRSAHVSHPAVPLLQPRRDCVWAWQPRQRKRNWIARILTTTRDQERIEHLWNPCARDDHELRTRTTTKSRGWSRGLLNFV